MSKTFYFRLIYQIPFAAGVFVFLWSLLSGLDDLLFTPAHLHIAIWFGTIGWLLMVIGWSLRSIYHILERNIKRPDHHFSAQR
ncbi:MAG TPA: hypothetical protein DCW31_09420 [Lactobacillus sp.]|nr:hypothetical protein [Lactobacillus sp.]